ncbi:hypothetical protein [Vibrio vulnificus]|uniref:hypothetical protein n=1 Tax=Vibrio vulnificus TaxID=672 RepID=UPI003ED85F04
MNGIQVVGFGLLMTLLFGCSSAPDFPEGAITDLRTQQHMEERRWRSEDELKRDYIKLASKSSLPIQDALVKVIGTDSASAVQSIADKIYLIENAKYTVDLAYYIFSPDIVGEAVLGALCNAVKRGVDSIRPMNPRGDIVSV